MNKTGLYLFVGGLWLGLTAFPHTVGLAPGVKDKDEVSSKRYDFKAGNRRFELNSQPFVVKAAELHYPRIPMQYWEHRIRMCKALGMNTICLYVFWNVHEPRPGEFDFAADRNLRKFVELCGENDMKVILRPGPYVCAEWEMGGLPWWLLKEDDIELRKSDPRFLKAVERFENRLKQELHGLTAPEGGPIIMIQVENEYGSYGSDKGYVGAIADMLSDLYPGVALFQCDWSSNFTVNGLPDLLWTMNFGTGADINSQFEHLKELRPDTPLMCSEFWSGWFDKWGAPHETRPSEAMTAGIEEMMEKGISFSLYMTHGGTNFGHWAGANSPGYAPDVTSYDYDAPINEQGAPTEKYYRLREVMQRYNDGRELPEMPEVIPVGCLPKTNLQLVAPLDSLWEPEFESVRPEAMEKYDLGYGMIRYNTILDNGSRAGDRLQLAPRDFVQVFADGRFLGVIDRKEGDTEICLPDLEPGVEISLVVEAMGRINFGTAIKDPKGMAGDVVLCSQDGRQKVIEGWRVARMPDDFTSGSALYTRCREGEPVVTSGMKDSNGVERLPRGLYRGHINEGSHADTYLDMSGWGKGQVWVNGHALGRFWEIGPQQTLFLPGVWLGEGENEIVVLDILGPRTPEVEGVDKPVTDCLQNFGATTESSSAKAIELNGLTPFAVTKKSTGNGWRRQTARNKRKGTQLALEIKKGENDAPAAIAEIYLTDGNGNRVEREKWRVLYAGSADRAGNHGADKLFDLQESTYWQATEPGTSIIVIDLGEEVEAGGFEYLPRAESGAPGLPTEISVYLLENK